MMLRMLPRDGVVLSNGVQGEEVGMTVCDAVLEGCRVREGLKVIDDDNVCEELDRCVVSSVLDDVMCSAVDDVISEVLDDVISEVLDDVISEVLDDVICEVLDDVISEVLDDVICEEPDKLCVEPIKDVSEVVNSNCSVVGVLVCVRDDCTKSWIIVTELEEGTTVAGCETVPVETVF